MVIFIVTESVYLIFFSEASTNDTTDGETQKNNWQLFILGLGPLMPRYLVWVTDGTQFVVPGGRRRLLHGRRARRSRRRLGVLAGAVSSENRHAFPVVVVIVLPQADAAVVARTRQDRSHDVPAYAPHGTIMIVELRHHGYFVTRYVALHIVP